MCGIFGYFDRRGISMDPNTLSLMGKVIAHRGPDESGIFTKPGLAIGNQRLSIIDLKNGKQPMLTHDGKTVLVQNGEVYNFIELARELNQAGFPCETKSDTEVILKAYAQAGIDCLPRLNGMFAIAIYDQKEEAIFLARDRMGVKPLYFYDDGQRLTFSSEIKSLLQAGAPRKLNSEALQHYLSFNFVPPPFTLFQGIQHLMPGHWLKISKRETKIVRWWHILNLREEIREPVDWQTEFLDLLDDAVKIRMRADVPFGAFLSGGIDSSSVVALMSRHQKMPVKTFTIGFPDPRFDESAAALSTSRKFHTEHHQELFDSKLIADWPQAIYFTDQPHGDISFLPTHTVSKLAHRFVKMVLTGDGGDELFAGYDKYRDFFDGTRRTNFQKDYFQFISLFNDADKAALWSKTFRLQNPICSAFEIAAKIFQECTELDPINQALYLDTLLLLPGNNLVKPDRMGMATSLEARNPFMDYRMVEFAYKIPGQLKLKDGVTKYIYKEAVRSLLGDEIVDRKKQMFTVPVGEWFRKELRGFSEAILLSERTLARDLFDQKKISQLLRDHQSGAKNYTREIRALIALEIWHRTFIDELFDHPPNWQELGLRSGLPA